MAIIIPGVAVSQASGRVGGIIFSRNRGGLYMRNGSKPTVVTTPYAQNIKALTANFSAQWRNLTEAQREAWKEWATQNPVTNRLGQSRTLSGHQAYVKINVRLAAAGGSSLSMPPLGIAPLGVLPTDVTFTTSPLAISVAFAGGPTPENVAVQVLAYLSDSPGVSYVRNRLALIQTTADEQASPIDITTELTNRFGTPTAGQRLHVGLRTIDLTTGLISTPAYYSGTLA